MRDFLLNEALKRLATEAATRFSSLLAAGEEIPFDVGAESGQDSPFYSYVPLTGRYVAEHAEELRSLPGFAAAREAAMEAGIAAPYLEARGEIVPPDPGARAELMLVTFFAALWDGASGFALDRDRLEEALALLDAEGRDVDDADVLIVPIVGLRMSMPRLSLPNGVRVVRADSIEAPVEAMRSEGMGRAAWEPQFLAVAEQDPDEAAEEALLQLRELISVMRLFKAGGVGLGPYAFAPAGSECWNRIATGAPATRPGGYRLAEEEAEELAEFARALESRPDPDRALAWAVGRFEMGCERESSLEGLSDLLLAMRAVLEGHGPVGATLAMRAAALMAAADDSVERIEARERIEAALELERAMMNGRPVVEALELSAWIEQSARGLLRQAALGELGADLGIAADETLIAAGLAEGDAQITVSVETPAEDAPDARTSPELSRDFADPSSKGSPGIPGREAEEMPAYSKTSPAPDSDRSLTPSESGAGPSEHSQEPDNEFAGPADHFQGEPLFNQHEQEDEHMQETRIMEPIPAEDEIRITATPWLEEVSEERPGDSLEWPAPSVERDLQHRERIDTPRVRHLFPVPDSDWDVPHLEYEHYGKNAS